MPAEWAPHQGTWLSWPHNLETWPEELPFVEAAMARVVHALAPHETVHVNVRDAAHERQVRARLDEGGTRGTVRFHAIPTNDAWIRDHGALFVRRDARHGAPLAATTWRFNSWGGKYPPWDLDTAVPARMAEALGVPAFDGGLVLEGGSVDVNGAGLLLTTEACLLHPSRNPGLSRSDLEARLCAFLGAEQVLWLADGIAGDDTDGHVDDLTRFVAEDTVVTVVEDDREEVNFAPLQENLERLRGMTALGGRPLRIETLPMPRPVVLKGERMPASYANFYVANGVVLLPVYEDPNDEEAARTLARLFPGRAVVPVDCRFLIWGLGAIHCLTQQVPSVR
jgi:agmatine deiminase